MSIEKMVAKSGPIVAPGASLLSGEAPATPDVGPGVVPGPVERGKHRARGQARPLFDAPIVRRAVAEAFRKLAPRHQLRNPVMFVVEVGSALTTGLVVQAVAGHGEAPTGFILAVSLWLWFTVLFANFAEAMAEGRGKAQADTLRQARKAIHAKRLIDARRDAATETVVASQLRKGDHVLVPAGKSSPATAKSWRASRPSTRAPSRGRARRSSARAAATGAR